MRVNVTSINNKEDLAGPLGTLVVPVYKKNFPLNSSILEAQHEEALQALIDRDIITGAAKESYFLPTHDGLYNAVLVLGLGEEEKCDTETLRRSMGAACSNLKTNKVSHICFDLSHFAELDPSAFLEAVVLGQYDFEVYKSKDEDAPEPTTVQETHVLVHQDIDAELAQQSSELAVLACLSTNGARHLANTPANELTPTALADFAQGIANESGCECTILGETQMASLGMNAILGVSKGSAQPAKLIVLRHHHSDDAKTVAIVGKGVTFDTGGISIKPAADMHEMKYDMCGAAAVLCAMMNIVELKPPINVICVVPTAENMTGDAAQRPGDIVKAYNGKTIEVHNTDAEGRLILADALAYTVDKYKPDAIVDLATLTGACVVALGHVAAGVFTNSDSLALSLADVGEQTGERVWQLPLWPEYEELIKGNHADLCNIGPRWGGAITAAAFLKQFIGETPWAHVDIAGTAWGADHLPYLNSKHATGFGVRLLTSWILGQIEGIE